MGARLRDTQENMRTVIILFLTILTIESFGQTDSIRTEDKQVKKIIKDIKKRIDGFHPNEKTYSPKDLEYKPIFEDKELRRVEVWIKDKLYYYFWIDSKTKQIGEIIDFTN